MEYLFETVVLRTVLTSPRVFIQEKHAGLLITKPARNFSFQHVFYFLFSFFFVLATRPINLLELESIKNRLDDGEVILQFVFQ